MSDGELTQGALARSLVLRLSEAIIQGEIPLSAKLSERVLARQHGVSRGALREALNGMQERRPVERRPRLGARVVALSVETFWQIYGVQEALGGMAGRGVRAVVEHRRILDAVEGRDPDMAEWQMQRHVTASYAALAPLLEQLGAAGTPSAKEERRR
jgi:DNA-binding GntR family transcriptional regulator